MVEGLGQCSRILSRRDKVNIAHSSTPDSFVSVLHGGLYRWDGQEVWDMGAFFSAGGFWSWCTLISSTLLGG